MVCAENICCGCGACVSICPKNCIKLTPNEYGVLLPEINNDMCINCGLCDKTCPNIDNNLLHNPQKCYAAYTNDKEKRLNSASGGIARILYENFLEEPNSYIVGVSFDSQHKPKFKLTNNKQDIVDFQGSKYVQAFPENIYNEVEKKVNENNRVLFIGMPCQIAAAKKYFEVKKLNKNNILLVDILCHGVTPFQYLEEYLDYLKLKIKWKKINNITFRSNRKFRNFHFCLDYIDKKGASKTYNKYAYESFYFNSFLDGSSMRESCYTCQFSQLNRGGDITIGDFIGLGKMKSSTEYKGNPQNASLILCNSVKGLEFINKIKDNLEIFERPIEEAYEGGASLQKPYRKSKWRDKFLKSYKKGTFVQTMKKIGGYELKKERLKLLVIRNIKELYMKIAAIKY